MILRMMKTAYRFLIFKPFIYRDNVPKIRKNIKVFLNSAVSRDLVADPVLDIGPSEGGCSQSLFSQRNGYRSLDIDPDSEADIIADLTNMPNVPDESFGTVICTEVLEHTLQPFNAVAEIHRILKPNGVALVTTPFNLRIHGPAPDCWRFTETGLRVLFEPHFDDLQISALRPLIRRGMPYQYTLIARKNC